MKTIPMTLSSGSTRQTRRASRPLGLPLACASALTCALALVAACSDTKSATGQGDNVIDDTRNQPRPPANPDPPVDASVDTGPLYDANGNYKPLTACSDCACTPDTHFCFGGGASRSLSPQIADAGAASSDAGDGGDGGLAACPLPGSAGGGEAGTIQVGCNNLPAECAATPTCACVLNAIQPHFQCYLVCHDPGASLLVYCPSP